MYSIVCLTNYSTCVMWAEKRDAVTEHLWYVLSVIAVQFTAECALWRLIKMQSSVSTPFRLPLHWSKFIITALWTTPPSQQIGKLNGANVRRRARLIIRAKPECCLLSAHARSKRDTSIITVHQVGERPLCFILELCSCVGECETCAALVLYETGPECRRLRLWCKVNVAIVQRWLFSLLYLYLTLSSCHDLAFVLFSAGPLSFCQACDATSRDLSHPPHSCD